MHFDVSGIDVSPIVPLLVAFIVSTVTSMGGVSGAFVLLPFQVSVLGFVGPAVTPTNHLFNVVAIPSGVYRYVREHRMVWPLAALIVVGTLPGVVAGSLVRIYLLPDPRHFKLFMGLVLLFIGSRLVRKVLQGRRAANASSTRSAPAAARAKGGARAERAREDGRAARGEDGASVAQATDERVAPRSEPSAQPPATGPAPLEVRTVSFGWRRLEYEFEGQIFRVSTPALAALTAVIGVVGGAYGVGGGAIIAPILVTMFGLPVHTLAGATLLGTWLTSVVGVVLFTLAGPLLGTPAVAPDWLLGGLLGVGGLGGMYAGARLQKRVSSRWIEALLGLVVSALAVSYVVGFFRG